MKDRLLSLIGRSLHPNAIQSAEQTKLEELLTQQFTPVAPRTSYVSDLGKRLSYQSEPITVQVGNQKDEIGFWQGMLLITAGVISGLLIAFFVAKFLASLFSARKLRT